MTTKQIDYCIELSRTESFSRGAENMFVSQPTFSYQIKLLEELQCKIQRKHHYKYVSTAGSLFPSRSN